MVLAIEKSARELFNRIDLIAARLIVNSKLERHQLSIEVGNLIGNRYRRHSFTFCIELATQQ